MKTRIKKVLIFLLPTLTLVAIVATFVANHGIKNVNASYTLYYASIIEHEFYDNVESFLNTSYHDYYYTDKEFNYIVMPFTTRRAYAGERLNLGSGISRGTIGANVLCNLTGRRGILTNYHVAMCYFSYHQAVTDPRIRLYNING